MNGEYEKALYTIFTELKNIIITLNTLCELIQKTIKDANEARNKGTRY